VTRAVPLWALFAVVVGAAFWLSRRRGLDLGRVVSAWAISSVLLWICAAVFGYAGAALVQRASGNNPIAGIAIGAPVGAVVGAPLGIALSERALRKTWPRWTSLALAGLALIATIAAVLFILRRLENYEQQAGAPVLVVFPLLSAAAVLGWVAGHRP
jgi:hypothetical protein